MKKWIALLLTLMMVFSAAVGAVADDPDIDEILDGLTEEQKRELLFALMEDMFSIDVEDTEAEGYYEGEDGEDDSRAVPEEEAPVEEAPEEEASLEEELDKLFAELFGSSSEDEETKAPVYESFGEHLAALISKVDFKGSDLQLALTSVLGSYLAVLGNTEDGFFAKLSSDENQIGVLQVNQEAVYLSMGDQVMGIKVEELKKLLENAAKGSSDESEPGFSSEQLRQDAQVFAAWGQKLWEKVQPSFILEQVSENERRVTVDSAAFAEAFVAGMEEIMQDPAFDGLYSRYAKLVSRIINESRPNENVQLPDAETFKTIWASSRYATMSLIAQISMTLNLRQEETGLSFTFEGQAPVNEGVFAILRGDGQFQGLGSSAVNLAVFTSDDPDNAKAVAHITSAFDGSGLTFHADAESNGQTAAVDGKASMNLFGMSGEWNDQVTVNGEKVITSEGTVDLLNKSIDIKAYVAAKKANVHLSYDGTTLKVEADVDGRQVNAAVWCEEIDANNMKVHVSYAQNGQNAEYELLASIVPMNPEEADEPEVLTLSVYPADHPDSALGTLVIGTIAAEEDPALDKGTVEWMDAETLPMMFMMMMPGMMAPPSGFQMPAA